MMIRERNSEQLRVSVPLGLAGLVERAAARKASTVSGVLRELLVRNEETLRQWAGDGEAAA